MPKLTIRTKDACWVIPEHFEIVKSMIVQDQLRESELWFSSARECQYLARRLSLLALKDECTYRVPSVIAELSRQLVAKSSNYNT